MRDSDQHVRVDPPVYKLLKDYSKHTGVPIKTLTRKALNFAMNHPVTVWGFKDAS